MRIPYKLGLGRLVFAFTVGTMGLDTIAALDTPLASDNLSVVVGRANAVGVQDSNNLVSLPGSATVEIFPTRRGQLVRKANGLPSGLHVLTDAPASQLLTLASKGVLYNHDTHQEGYYTGAFRAVLKPGVQALPAEVLALGHVHLMAGRVVTIKAQTPAEFAKDWGVLSRQTVFSHLRPEIEWGATQRAVPVNRFEHPIAQ